MWKNYHEPKNKTKQNKENTHKFLKFDGTKKMYLPASLLNILNKINFTMGN